MKKSWPYKHSYRMEKDEFMVLYAGKKEIFFMKAEGDKEDLKIIVFKILHSKNKINIDFLFTTRYARYDVVKN